MLVGWWHLESKRTRLVSPDVIYIPTRKLDHVDYGADAWIINDKDIISIQLKSKLNKQFSPNNLMDFETRYQPYTDLFQAGLPTKKALYAKRENLNSPDIVNKD